MSLLEVELDGTALRGSGLLSGKGRATHAKGEPLVRSIALVLAIVCSAARLTAQHDMSRMSAIGGRPDLDRTASGTSWLPDSAPHRMWMRQAGAWRIAGHGSATGMFNRQWTLHGDTQWGLVDWEMIRASRPVGAGTVRLSVMTSMESFFLPDTGYAQLLQSGESFRGRRLANVQHPHDLLGELSAFYEHPLTSKFSWSSYAGLVGEPALGPVASRHRPSAAADPFAPLGSHWQDGAHQSHGVVTVGLASRGMKLETSAFNGRDPDAKHRDIELWGLRLDSYATRLSVAPSGRLVASAWAGYLASHDPLDPGVGMQRFGASVVTETKGIGAARLSSAIVWGMNNHHHGTRGHSHDSAGPPMTHHLSSSVLLESTMSFERGASIFGRVEQVQKTADDLGFLGGNLMESFNVRAISLGATHRLATRTGLGVWAGGRLAVNLLPATLRYTYTTTHPAGFVLFLRILPSPAPAM